MLSGCWKAIALSLALSFGAGAFAAESGQQEESYENKVIALDRLLSAGQFGLLEQELAQLAASDRLFADGRNMAAVVHITLRAVLNPAYYSTDRERKGVLERWRAAFPRSGFIAITDAIALQDAEIAVRGTAPAHRVPPESHELFKAKLRQADRLLMGAPVAVRDTAVWHLVRLQVLCGLRDKQAHAVFEAAFKRWPRHIDFNQTVVALLLPDQGGSWAAVTAFIEDAYRRAAPADSASLYTHLHVYLRPYVGPGKLTLNWPRAKLGFADWMRRDSSPMIANYYASFACLAQDKPAFDEAMGLIGLEVFPTQWLTGHGPEACRRWAGNQ